MNEPRLVGDPNEWNGGNQEARQVINSYNQTFVNTVRATGGNNAIRCLMVPTYAASCSSTTVSDFVLPTDTVANKLIVDIHSYSPYNFALNTSGTSSFTQSDISQLQWTLQEIYNSFGAKGIPVIIGEFGALNKTTSMTGYSGGRIISASPRATTSVASGGITTPSTPAARISDC